jgi:uncharacterized protein YaaN involved in tellurite resistance
MRLDVYIHSDDHPESLTMLRDIVQRLTRIEAQGEKIMSAISDFAAKQKAFNATIDSAITGITGDVKTLNDKIAALQASAGTVTPEDQALLDELEAAGNSLASRVTALDDLTPPTPPAP